MAFILTTTNVQQRMYPEIIAEISRADTATVQAAIDAALDEAKGYLSRYDTAQILGTVSTNATVNDRNLLSKLKDLFAWHFIALANPNIDYDATQQRYIMAIEKYFERVQSGKIVPEGWPYKDTSTLPAMPEGLEVTYKSNPKRNNHF